jgi:hypothetical protein
MKSQASSIIDHQHQIEGKKHEVRYRSHLGWITIVLPALGCAATFHLNNQSSWSAIRRAGLALALAFAFCTESVRHRPVGLTAWRLQSSSGSGKSWNAGWTRIDQSRSGVGDGRKKKWRWNDLDRDFGPDCSSLAVFDSGPVKPRVSNWVRFAKTARTTSAARPFGGRWRAQPMGCRLVVTGTRHGVADRLPVNSTGDHRTA